MLLTTDNKHLAIPDHNFKKKLAQRFDAYKYQIYDHLNDNTKRAYTLDLNCYLTYCAAEKIAPFNPALEQNLSVMQGYFDYLMQSALGHHSIKRRLNTIGGFYEYMEVPNPRKQSKIFNDSINLKLRAKPAFQKQAEPLTIDLLNEFNETYQVTNLKMLRDKAIINLAFDAMLRGSEVVNVKVSHLQESRHTLFLPRRKTDQSGQGGYAYVSEATFKILNQYMSEAQIIEGWLFRQKSPKGTTVIKPDEALSYRAVLRAFKLIGKTLGLEVNFTSHSGRVGKSVSMVQAGADLVELMHAGGWSSSLMPAKYSKQAKLAMGIGARLR